MKDREGTSTETRIATAIASVNDLKESLDRSAVLSCGGVYLKRGCLNERLRTWKTMIHLPHEEGTRTYQINRQTTESVFHLILRQENLN